MKKMKRGGQGMCPRCNGLLFSERLSDFFVTFYAWKCVNCGAVVDRTILLNKKHKTSFNL